MDLHFRRKLSSLIPHRQRRRFVPAAPIDSERLYAATRRTPKRCCRLCGCDDDHACQLADGRPCSWIAWDLCSAHGELAGDPLGVL
ncbi:MAG: hypothetical protein IVW53_15330 [Chloroflexi bacterium]|nr:hypothetical protein [Chloroflexota bacterium]